MATTLIQQNPNFDKKVDGKYKLAIAEMFCDTIQGEGVSTGVVSTFIRLQGCTLKCVWCDTLEVWPNGNEYSFAEIFEMFESVGLIEKFKNGQHLIFTGGSPLKQQDQILDFLDAFFDTYEFIPYIEVENECTLIPNDFILTYITQWNNSPKLSNSGMKAIARIKPDVLKILNNEENSWFKFVIANHSDWDEIEKDYLPWIDKDKIILMPEGVTQEELAKNREWVADMAIKHGVRYSDRMHVVLWNKKTGV